MARRRIRKLCQSFTRLLIISEIPKAILVKIGVELQQLSNDKSERLQIRRLCERWRKTYVTSSGDRGHLLFDTKCPKVQQDVREMTIAFLEDKDEQAFGAFQAKAQGLKLRYPEDKDRYGLNLPNLS